MSEFERKNKYVVIKLDDIDNYLTDEEREMLCQLVDSIAKMRELNGKRNKSFVCISDECPYYEEAWKLVEKWVEESD